MYQTEISNLHVFTVASITHLFSVLLSAMFKSARKLERRVVVVSFVSGKITSVEISVHDPVAVSAMDDITPASVILRRHL